MKNITKKVGAKPGKTVAIFGGVHGNERVGIEAVRWAVENVVTESGTVYFVEANPAAIAKNIRQINKNLNRCFLKGSKGTTVEDKRARELMKLLDTCDALLDIHSSNNKAATPFVICYKRGLALANKLDFSIVSTGWDAIEPGGTDGYMQNSGKLGMCIECGYAKDVEKNIELAKQSLLQFLEEFGIISSSGVTASTRAKRHIEVYKAALKKSDELCFAKEYADFETLVPGEIFARDGDIEYIAKLGDCIIFPHPDAVIGAEAFILGREVP